MNALERLASAWPGWRIADPAALAWLAAVALLATALGIAGLVRRRSALRRGFGDLGEVVAPGARAGGPAVRLALAGAGMLLLAVAAARPQAGIRTTAARAPALDLVVALDASRSMLARDVAPDRFGAARAAVAALLRDLPMARVAVVAFAADAFLQCPLTPDHHAALLLLDAVDPDAMPRQGTDLGAALDAARRALPAPGGGAGAEGGARVVLLVSDGEDHGTGADEAADRLALEGASVFTAGVGSRDGARVPRAGGDGFLVRDGAAVVSRLDDARLADLAARGGGRSVRLGEPSSTEDLARMLALEARQGSRSVRISGWDDRFGGFAVAGLVLLLASLAPPRRRHAALAATALLAGASPFLAEHAGLREANALAARDPTSSLSRFDDVEREVGSHPEIDVDRALALFRAGRVDEARRSFALSARSPEGNGPLKSRAAYAEGVAAVALGDEEGAITAWRRALVLDPANGDARFDLEVLLRRRAERSAHPPSGEGAGEGAGPGERGAAEPRGHLEGPERAPPEPRRLRAERNDSRQRAPMSRAEAERLLDAVAAGERVLPIAPPGRGERAATEPW